MNTYEWHAAFSACSGIFPVSRGWGGLSVVLSGPISGSVCGQQRRKQRGVTDLHLFQACTAQTQAYGYRGEAREPVLTWDWRPKSSNKETQSTLTDSTVTNVLQLFVDEMLKSVLEDIFFHVVILETYLIIIGSFDAKILYKQLD